MPNIYILSRNNYNELSNDQLGDNIFYVRENSAESNNIVSLYVGSSKQCDLFDITNICRSSTSNETIPQSNIITSHPVYPKTLELFISNVSSYTDDGHGNIINSSQEVVGTINYETGLIIYNTGIVRADKASYEYSVVDVYAPEYNYHIPDRFKISNKLFLYEQILSTDGRVLDEPYYFSVMWNPSLNSGQGKFIECSPKQYISKEGTLSTISRNVFSGTDMPLESIITTDENSGTSYTSAILPRNGCELRLTSSSGIDTISFTDITKMQYYQGSTSPSMVDVSGDYISFIVFKKGSNVTDVKLLVSNFSPQASQRIYLMNPDKDISALTVIHLLLYNDGFNICAIVAGYNENEE